MSESLITKRAIAAALMELCVEKSFSKISVQDITKQVGLNRQTFYYHFSDKYDLLAWVYHQNALHFLEVPELDLTNWEEQALKMLKAMKESKLFYENTVQSDSDILMQSFSAITKQLFVKLFNQIDEEKLLLPEDKEFYARFFSYGCSGVLVQWIVEGFVETPIEIAGQIFRLAKDTEFFSYKLYQKENEE